MSTKMVTIRIRRAWIRFGVVAAVVALVATSATAFAQRTAFDDVSPSNVFVHDIMWLSTTGVTKGCNPPQNNRYCPAENVTRQQMAAFMRRLAENRVVDARWLNGNPAGDFTQDLRWETAATEGSIGGEDERPLQIDCPAGTKVVSGGGSESNKFTISKSLPLDDRTGWQVAFHNPSLNERFGHMTGYALCARYNDKTPGNFTTLSQDLTTD